MSTLCETKAFAYYRNSTKIVVYLTLKSVGTGNIFSGRITLEKLPPFLLDQYINVFSDSNPTDQTTYKERRGNKFETTLIDRFEILRLADFAGAQEISDISTKNRTLDETQV